MYVRKTACDLLLDVDVSTKENEFRNVLVAHFLLVAPVSSWILSIGSAIILCAVAFGAAAGVAAVAVVGDVVIVVQVKVIGDVGSYEYT